MSDAASTMVPYLEIFKINAVQVLPCGNDPGQDGDPAEQGAKPETVKARGPLLPTAV